MSNDQIPPVPLTHRDVVERYFDFELYDCAEPTLRSIMSLALQRTCGLISGPFYMREVRKTAVRNNFPKEHAVLLAEHVYEVLSKGSARVSREDAPE